MKKGMKETFMALTLAMAMASTITCGTVTNAAKVKNEKTIKTDANTSLKTSEIAPPSTDANAKEWTGNYAIFGESYDVRVHLYRILSPKTTEFTDAENPTVLLQSDTGYSVRAYNGEAWDERYDHYKPEYEEWANTRLREYLNGNGFFNRGITDPERNAIATSKKTEPVQGVETEVPGNKFGPLSPNGDKVFVLDACELMRPDFGYTNDNTRKVNDLHRTAGPLSYWTRSTCDYREKTAYNTDTSEFEGIYVHDGAYVIPALNLDLKEILFATDVSTDASGEYGHQYKFTFVDQRKEIHPGEVTKDGNKVTVPCSITGNGASNATLFVTDKAYDADDARMLYYETKEVANMDQGTYEYTLPENLPEDCHVYMAAELVHGSMDSDDTSLPVEIQVPVSTAGSIFSNGATIWIIAGAGAALVLIVVIVIVATKRKKKTGSNE